MKPNSNINKRKDGTNCNNDDDMNENDAINSNITITSYIHNEEQPDNKDDRLSMFADDSSIITKNAHQTQQARRNMKTYEKSSGSQLHEGKTKIIKLGIERTNNETNESLNVNFTIMQDDENENFLEDIIGKNVTEIQTFQKPL